MEENDNICVISVVFPWLVDIYLQNVTKLT